MRCMDCSKCLYFRQYAHSRAGSCKIKHTIRLVGDDVCLFFKYKGDKK